MKRIVLLSFFAIMANLAFGQCVVEKISGPAPADMQPNTEYTLTYRFVDFDLNTGGLTPKHANWSIPVISGATITSTNPADLTAQTTAGIQVTFTTGTGGAFAMTVQADGVSPACTAFGEEGSNVLPVELVSFDGRNINKNVALEWRTASELNNDFFTVERSTNGKDFRAIGKVKGAGNSVEEITYTFNDETVNKVTSNIVYYRLKQTDFDGTSTYQEMIEVKLDNAKRLELTNVLVKSTNQVEVKFTSAFNKSANIQIFDMAGRQVGTTTVNAVEGFNAFNVNLENTSKGVYFVRISNGSDIATRKFVL